MTRRIITKTYSGPKLIIALLSGIAVFIGVFMLDRLLINWICSNFTFNHNIILLIKLGLWVLAFGWTTGIAMVLSWLITMLVGTVLGVFK